MLLQLILVVSLMVGTVKLDWQFTHWQDIIFSGECAVFLHSGTLTFNQKYTNDPKNTVERCRAICATFTTEKFFGLPDATSCFCAKQLLGRFDIRPKRECSTVCSGDDKEGPKCGGPGRMSIYSVDKKIEYKPAYEGCYADLEESPVLTGDLRMYRFFRMSVYQCKKRCRRLAKYGVEYYGVSGMSCTCAAKLSGGVKRPESECDTPCNGNKKYMCGGESTISIYHI